MSNLPNWRRYLTFWRTPIAQDVDDEMRFHAKMRVQEYVARGMSEAEARRAVAERLGDVPAARAECIELGRVRERKARNASFIDALVGDIRYALRGLRLTPVFTAGVILTLGLGVGANATMFGIVDRLLFRPPEYLIAPERTTRLYVATTDRGKEDVGSTFGYRRYTDIRDGTRSFDAMVPFTFDDMAVGEGEATAHMKVASAGADVWSMFDVKPVIGRFFTAAEDRPPTGTPVVVLSYAFWQTRFGR